jgi:hypothetical protein
MYIGTYVKEPLFLSDFHQRRIFSADSEKQPSIKFHENGVVTENKNVASSGGK